MAVKKVKLTPKEVEAYEKASGFKTTGDVTLSTADDETFKLMEELLAPKGKPDSSSQPRIG